MPSKRSASLLRIVNDRLYGAERLSKNKSPKFKIENQLNLLSTHPATIERIEALEKGIAAIDREFQPIEFDFRILKNIHSS